MGAQVTLAAGNEKGVVIVYLAVVLLVLLGFLGLAVDTGHLYKVRSELQTAADAAAMKGARFLYNQPVNPAEKPQLQWDVALAKARETIPDNLSDGQSLPDAIVSVGYWNLGWDSSTQHDLLPTTTVTTPGDLNVAAVKVTVKRDAENNNGMVGNFFMQVLAADKKTVAVNSRPAVAISGFPASASPGDVFPLAISKQVTDAYFSQNPLPVPPIPISLGYGATKVTVGGISYFTGQWTSFLSTDDSASAIRTLIETGNPESLKVTDPINIAAGVKAALYTDGDWLPPGGKDVVLPVVDNGTGDFTKNIPMKITGFTTFHLDSLSGASDKYITGHFINYFTTPTGFRAGGTPSNTITMPVLVQ